MLKRYWSARTHAAHGNFPLGATTTCTPPIPPEISFKQGILAIVLATFSLGGCGDKDEPTVESSSSTTTIEGVTDEQLDKTVEQTQNRMKNALKSQGIGGETAKGGYAVGGEHDGESFSMGVDLDIPAWLPAGFPLPEDLSIKMVTADKEGRRELRGSSARVQQANIANLVEQWAASHNWEVVRSTDVMLTLAKSDGQVLDVRADDGTGLEVILSRRSLAIEQQQAAPERRGPGRAKVTMASDSRTVQGGECLIKGSSYQFEYSTQDGSVFASVQIQDAHNTPAGSATFMTNAAGQFKQFNINFPMNNDNEPVVTVSGDKFSVNGMFASMGGGSLSAVDGTISVNCEF